MAMEPEQDVEKTIITEAPADAAFPGKNDMVKVHYVGTLVSDGKQFDSSRQRGKMFEFQLGAGKVIKGWEIAVAGMKKGERAMFKIPHQLGYGEQGSPPVIPGAADLNFDIELFDFFEKKREKWEMTFDEKLAEAKSEKEKGTVAFKAADMVKAFEHWSEGVDYVEDLDVSMRGDDAEFLAELDTLKKSLYLNLAQTSLKLEDWDNALLNANKALEIEETNSKAWFRRAVAYIAKEEFAQAKFDLKQALQHDPKNAEIRKKFDECKKKEEEFKKKQKSQFGNMFKKSMYNEKEDIKVAKVRTSEDLEKLPQVYFDVQFGDKSDPLELKRITMRLYSDIVPKTAENFRQLCTGESEKTATNGQKLTYEGCAFHRVIPGFMMQGGDFTRGDGTGGESIYGEKFNDENLTIDQHVKRGMLSMANAGPNTNGSQFFVTFKDTPHLDGRHCVFGEVVDGFDVLELVEQAETAAGDKPVESIIIKSCGEIKPKTCGCC
ncbi:unnamed protein product [Amoebophrya sp. A120]|nr:unnamed protein product [Amoebophrya sp. A120]|eukprot:GSA120T00014851001.1